MLPLCSLPACLPGPALRRCYDLISLLLERGSPPLFLILPPPVRKETHLTSSTAPLCSSFSGARRLGRAVPVRINPFRAPLPPSSPGVVKAMRESSLPCFDPRAPCNSPHVPPRHCGTRATSFAPLPPLSSSAALPHPPRQSHSFALGWSLLVFSFSSSSSQLIASPPSPPK
mgnify:FL=1